MSRLKIYLLGLPRVEIDDQPVEISRRKALALLAYLAMTRQAHSREVLATLLWPDVEPGRAYAYLRTALWTLNKALGETWITADREVVELDPAGALWVDACHFEARLRDAATGDPRFRVAGLAEAAALYQDDFLAGFMLPDSPAFDEWQFFERERLRQQFGQTLDDLVEGQVSLGHFETAIPYAQRRLALDTLHEPAHRQLMRLYAWTGQWSAALRQYQQGAALLAHELGTEPDAETRELFHAIQERQVASPLPPRAPAATSSAASGHLPIQNTPFIGRERELDELKKLIGDPACRLLSLIGQGGIGKTRLALQTAAEVADHYRDGAYFVPLAPVSRAEYLVSALADALQFFAQREGDPKLHVLSYLNEKHMLLVMDNFEHLLDGADLVTEILSHAPQVKIITTSRERLQLQEEWIYELHGLSHQDAVQLLVHSGHRVRPDFTLTDDNTPDVLRICQLVEGMPLGLELAAAWLPMLSPREIAQEIERSLDFLAASLRNLPARHRSVRAVFQSTWERLSPVEQMALSKLAVFQGQFRREAAQAVTEAPLPVLLALVNRSLLHRDNDSYAMHELLRQFARERLDESPATRDQTYDRHANYYAAFVHERVPALKSRAQVRTLNEIEAEIDNIRAAWMFAVGRRDPGPVRKLLRGLALFYLMRSRLKESSEMFGGTAHYLETLDNLTDEERLLLAYVKISHALALRELSQNAEAAAQYWEVLPVLSTLREPEVTTALIILCDLSIFPIKDYPTSEALARQVLAISEAQHDQWGIGRALHLLGDVAHHAVHYDQSYELYQQSLAISRSIGDQWGEEIDIDMLGEVAYTLGHYPEAEQLFREASALAETVGDRSGVAWCLSRIAQLQTWQGRHQEARETVAECSRVAREYGNRDRMAYLLAQLAEIALSEGDTTTALHYFEQSLSAFREIDSTEGAAWLRILRCQIALDAGNTEEIERFARESLATFEVTESPWGRSASLYFLGEAARLRGDMAEARVNFQAALRLATESQSIMFVVRYLIGFGMWFAQTGHPERAVELLTLTVQHPATWQMLRDRATRLIQDLSAELPPDLLIAARTRGTARSVEEVAAELLRDSG